jgi:ATP-dependent DNA helicase DinG
VLGPGGIAREVRDPQLQMAEIIEKAIKENIHAIIEAGTGTGKSFGYLVPAILSGKRIVIATATIALQSQLFQGDIPFLRETLYDRWGIRFTAGLRKGRGNFLCQKRFAEAGPIDARLFSWGKVTQTGDREELDFEPSRSDWAEVRSDGDRCPGKKCAYRLDCHYYQAKDKTKDCEIIVTNHATLAMDLLLGGILLDDYDVLIVDEAHQLEKSIQDAFTKEIKGTQVRRLVKDIEREFKGFEAAALDGEKPIGPNLLQAFGALFSRVAQLNPRAKDDFVISLLDCSDEVLDVLEQLERAEHFINRRAVKENDQHSKLTERLGKLADALTEMSSKYRDNTVCWLERRFVDGESKMTLKTAPVSVAPILGSLLFNQGKSVILTSATISTGGDFDYFKSNMGVETKPGQEMIVGSPFDYEERSALYIPRHIPDPPKGRDELAAKRYQDAILDEIKDLVELSGGRAFCLFTSNAAMQKAYLAIAPRIKFPSKMQGDMPKGPLIEWFKTTARPVLFATASFWEGVSIEGEQLQLVTIDKVPFPNPSDPIFQAKEKRIRRPRSAFQVLSVPEAIIRLKQGFGRLIRTQRDRGIVAILDSRLHTAKYGRTIINSLPPARLVTSLDEIDVSAYLADERSPA